MSRIREMGSEASVHMLGVAELVTEESPVILPQLAKTSRMNSESVSMSGLAIMRQPITECWPYFRIADNRSANPSGVPKTA
jgi:hypothetical protein